MAEKVSSVKYLAEVLRRPRLRQEYLTEVEVQVRRYCPERWSRGLPRLLSCDEPGKFPQKYRSGGRPIVADADGPVEDLRRCFHDPGLAELRQFHLHQLELLLARHGLRLHRSLRLELDVDDSGREPRYP